MASTGERIGGAALIVSALLLLTTSVPSPALADPSWTAGAGPRGSGASPLPPVDTPSAGGSGRSADPPAPRHRTPSSNKTTKKTAGQTSKKKDPPVRSARVPKVADTAATEPVGLQIAALGLNVDVGPVGVSDDGQMALPPDPADAGWYRFGARPADGRGSAVIAGHVDSRRTGLGPLAALAAARPGQQIVLTDRDRSTHRYTVDTVERMAKTEVDLDGVFRRDGPARLVLLTCGGPFTPSKGYRDLVVVTASPGPR